MHLTDKQIYDLFKSTLDNFQGECDFHLEYFKRTGVRISKQDTRAALKRHHEAMRCV